jgi:hypothetical protein
MKRTTFALLAPSRLPFHGLGLCLINFAKQVFFTNRPRSVSNWLEDYGNRQKSKRLLLRREELASEERRPMLAKSIRDLRTAIKNKDGERVDNALRRVDRALGTAGLKDDQYSTIRREIWANTKLLMGAMKAPEKGATAVTDHLSFRGQSRSSPGQERIREFGDRSSRTSRRAPRQSNGRLNSR